MLFNVFFILFCLVFQRIGNMKLIFLMIMMAILSSNILVNLAKKRTKRLIESELLLADCLKKLYHKKDRITLQPDKFPIPSARQAEISRN